METVHQLLLKPFSERSKEEQIKVLLGGRPTPKLNKFVFFDVNTDQELDIYERVPWLTGCDKIQAFFCWPCLLFMKEDRNEWNVTGFTEFSVFTVEMFNHKKKKSHVQALLDYHLFRTENCSVSIDQETVIEDTEKSMIENNYNCLRCIINALSFNFSNISPTIKENKGDGSCVECLDCVNVLQFLSAYESETTNLQNAIHLLKTNPKILTDVVCVLANAAKTCFKKEAQTSRYVSLILSEHSGNDNNSLLSTVLRYFKGDQVCERFVGFTVITRYKSADVLYGFISQIIEEFGIAEQFIAYSVDGAVLASSRHMQPLKTKLRDDYPFSYFVPCHFHDLDLVLEQSMSKLKEIKQFFKHLRSIKSFFHKIPKACRILEGFIEATAIDGLDRGEWNDTQFLKFLKHHRLQVIKFFESVSINHQFWGAEELPKALAYQLILQDFDTVFVLETFSILFNATSNLREALFGNSFDAAIDSKLRDTLKIFLDNKRDPLAFEIIWKSVTTDLLRGQEDTKNLTLQKAMEPERKLLYREFFLKIIDFMFQEIEQRFDSLSDLMFFHIFDPDKYDNLMQNIDDDVTVISENEDISLTTDFIKTPLESLLSVHGPYFEKEWVENELKVYLANKEFFSTSKSAYDILDLFANADLKTTLKNLYQIAQLILSMPCKPPCPTCKNQSKMKKINDWASMCKSKEYNDIALLCIEDEFLNEVKGQEEFLDDVMKQFQEINTTLPVVHCCNYNVAELDG